MKIHATLSTHDVNLSLSYRARSDLVQCSAHRGFHDLSHTMRRSVRFWVYFCDREALFSVCR